MAEALFKKYWFCRRRSVELVVTSAGIAARSGEAASDEVRQLLKSEEEIDAKYHSATFLTPPLVEKATLILVMGSSHKKTVEAISPTAAEKTFLLKEYTAPESSSFEISDPFGGNMEIYRQTMQEIKTLILKLIEKLERDRLP